MSGCCRTLISQSRTGSGYPDSRVPRAHAKSWESKKSFVIKTSFWLALSRCAAHLLPTLFSIVILTMNLKGYYIGEQFASLIRSETINLALLQTAAKVQELLIVASLATIILHITREELLYGSGLAIGLVGSGLAFSQIGYFFFQKNSWAAYTIEVQFLGRLDFYSPCSFPGLLLL
jgi:hypothetical protein